LAKLRRENEELRRQKAEIEKDRERLKKENEELREKLEAVQREMYRQAAPFRIDQKKRVQMRKRPGRKPGHPGVCRVRPDVVDDEVVVPLDGCPRCGKPVTGCYPVEQFIQDLPEMKPRTTRIVTYLGRCDDCGTVESRHPMQMSKGSGAAAVNLGPRVLAVATDLNKRLGLPLRKTCDVLRQHFSIQVSPGAIVYAQARLAEQLEPAYQELAKTLREGNVVYVDETSWWVGGPGYWLWTFTSATCTYDGVPGIQNKCYAHHLKAISKALETATDDKTCLQEIRNLLVTAIALGKSRDEIPAEEFNRFVGSLERRADILLQKGVADLAANKVAHRLLKQRDHLFTFLKFPGVDPTNNAAERALRPAVVARKISCGNKTDRGRRTWQVLTSLATTCQQRGVRFSRMLEQAASLAGPRSLSVLTLGRG
jgi:hypothetical protein